MITEIHLTEEELKNVKHEFKNGGVITDGCFCGEAIANIRDDLFVVLYFSCRKSSMCDNSYYKVNGVSIVEKALSSYSIEKVKETLNMLENEAIDIDDIKIENRSAMLIYNDYNAATIEDVYLERNDLILSEQSLKDVQKKLFKYYKKTYGEWGDTKFKDVGRYEYEK